MKKVLLSLLLLVVIVIGCVSLVGCNKQVFDFNYKFTNAYIKVGENWVDLEISTWNDYEGEQLQLTLKDGSVLIVHSANCILYKGSFPLAEKGS